MLNRLIVSVLVLLITGSMSTSAQAQSSAVTVWPDNGNSYQFLFANVTWTQAEALAEASIQDGRPGHLVTITSAAENAFVANLMGGDFRAWIGLSDVASEGSFEWVTGEPLTYTNWSGGEPNNSGGVEDYVELFASNDAWNDRVNSNFSSANAAYIIEWEAAPDVPEVFSIVVIPDTQMYVEQHPEIFEAQMNWIVANRDTSVDANGDVIENNIIYVSHLGDLKDDTSCDIKDVTAGSGPNAANPQGRTEWQIVDEAFDILDNANIPYGVVPGNHDFTQLSNQCPQYTCTTAEFGADAICAQRPLGTDFVPTLRGTYNELLGPSRFNNVSSNGYQPTYGDTDPASPFSGRTGNRQALSNEDNFSLIEFGGVKLIVINLGYREDPNAVAGGASGCVGASNPEIEWADDLLKDYDDRLGIITSHAFMTENTSDPGRNEFNPYGQCIYSELADNQNLLMMLSAHRPGEAWGRQARGTGLEPVHALLSDYQWLRYPTDTTNFTNIPDSSSNFGDAGFIRIMRFDTVTGVVDIETFSPAVSFTGFTYPDANLHSDHAHTNRTEVLKSTFTPPYPVNSENGRIRFNAGNGMDENTASNLCFTFRGYRVGVQEPAADASACPIVFFTP